MGNAARTSLVSAAGCSWAARSPSVGRSSSAGTRHAACHRVSSIKGLTSYSK
ncbi:hypothetical protein PR002_g23855 [Phytophthora rubi]|uniref:Uncharacterized protein n=1 Tax=Phytophthora rubi TaxID=129364 RepID=A0A6A3IHA5_9STRA|nr:hypothetical protein PR002_g23855 [Phytophthora rubi]